MDEAGSNRQGGLLLVWTDPPHDQEENFNDWCNREHVLDRINKVPGFIRARRFMACDAQPRYLNVYETTGTEIFQSIPYRALNKNPDARSQLLIPNLKNTIKAIGDVEAVVGQGEGAYLALMSISVSKSHLLKFRAWIRNHCLPEILNLKDVVAAKYAEHNKEVIAAAKPNYMRQGDRFIEDVILVESTSAGALESIRSCLTNEILAKQGATPLITEVPALFQLMYTVHAPIQSGS